MVDTEGSSNLGKWDQWYRNLQEGDKAVTYGDPLTYRIAASFFADMEEVEDWGCGRGGFRLFYEGKYVGIDGSVTPFADRVVDLCTYRSSAEAILLRHVLEHDYRWSKILSNAVASFRRKLCVVLFTDLSDTTREIAHNRHLGVDVPDLSLGQSELEKHFDGLNFRLVRGLATKTQYKTEHIYFVWRGHESSAGATEANQSSASAQWCIRAKQAVARFAGRSGTSKNGA